ncbi:Bax inhibitor-1/YccA family protein [Pseudarthrobacter sp. BIM B-2242]|uniref:Bax inhibitor-1/YccA family protein n=1 Tax=Pseudarthrobacter sp. BIM B-2242 TaxID=2772401 RepID=UPI00168AC7DA|nr:Bax inhibitor-1/YccA family protein [Pseudarthrobacter sp. BIM B-2242]QOD06122.1 Bax inhibitor-1/YccA family protein [Pseudarthrobacter sp. BIM B-2242]
MSNPVFNRKAEFLSVPDSGATMTYDDVIVKTLLTMGVLSAAAMVGWAFPALSAVGAIVAFIIGMIAIFKRRPSAPLTLAYGTFEGFAVGGLSAVFENLYPGIVLQAVIATFAVLAACLAAFKFGGFRATPAMVKMVLVAMIGYLVYSVVNLILVATGVINSPSGLNSMNIPGTSIPVGVVVGVLAVLLAAFCFIIDFTQIEDDVKDGAPAAQAWWNAFGLMLTIVWLYLEFLRLLPYLRGDD